MFIEEKGILKQFELVVYPVRIIVAIGDIEEEVNNHYVPENELSKWLYKPSGNSAAYCYNVYNKETEQNGLLIWFSDLEECKGFYMCHESGHAALEVFKYIGATINPEEDQECFCYLLGTVFRFINGVCHEYKEYLNSKTSNPNEANETF